MKILVDCRCFTRPIAGTATFLRLALENIQRSTDWELWLLTPRNFNEELDLRLNEKNAHVIKKQVTFFGMSIQLPNILWFLFVAPKVCREVKADVFFTPSPSLPFFLPRKVKTLIIVHDIVHILYKETMNLKNRILNLLFTNRSINVSKLIWVNSRYTKTQIEKYYPNRYQKHIYVGASDDTDLYKRLDMSIGEVENIKKKIGINNRFLLFVGTLEPRKNLAFLLRVFSRLAKNEKDLQLVVVGARGWKDSDIFKIVSNDDLLKSKTIFTGYMSNEDLVKLYNIANVFVSTSLNEGLGLPQLEAMFCGCPVVTSHNSAMIETTAGRGVTVKGWDVDVWVNAIENVLHANRSTFYCGKKDFSEYQWTNIIKGAIEYITNNH